jgi:site-specific recombinase XerD
MTHPALTQLRKLPYFQEHYKPGAAPRFRRNIKNEWRPYLPPDTPKAWLHGYGEFHRQGDYDGMLDRHHHWMTHYDRRVSEIEAKIAARRPPAWVQFMEAERERIGPEEVNRRMVAFINAPSERVEWPTIINPDPEFVARGQKAGAGFRFISDGGHGPHDAPMVSHGAPRSTVAEVAEIAMQPISTHVDAFLKSEYVKDVAARTRSAYGDMLKDVIDRLRDKPIGTVTVADRKALRRYWTEEAGKGSSWTKKRISHFRRFCEWATESGRMAENPAEGMKGVTEENEAHGIFAPHQIPILFEQAARHPNRYLVHLLRYLEMTGQRPGKETEKQMKLIDVSPQNGGKPNEVHTGSGKTGRRYFRACFPHRGDHAAELKQLIADIRAAHPTPDNPEALLFPTADYTGHFKEVLTQLHESDPAGHWLTDKDGNEIALYSFRHTFITQAILGGAHIETIAKFCGNSEATIRKSYWHVLDRDERDLAESKMTKAA